MTDDRPAYFVREDADRFRPTPLVGGAWSLDEQHVAPAIGLLAHCIELDRDRRRDDDLRLTRLDLWPGAFVRSFDGRRSETEPGRAIAWLGSPAALVAGEPVSSTAAALGLVDAANGTTPRVPPDRVAFPNLDLTAHLFRTPEAGPVGLDVRVSFGPDGAGLTLTVLHDVAGPFGSAAQTLTLRRR